MEPYKCIGCGTLLHEDEEWIEADPMAPDAKTWACASCGPGIIEERETEEDGLIDASEEAEYGWKIYMSRQAR